MSSLKDRLKRLTQSSAASTNNSEASLHQELPSLKPAAAPAEDPWSELEAVIYTNEGGSFVMRTKHYPLSYRHGHVPLTWNDSGHEGIRLLGSAALECDREQLLFLDTETTGLGIGAGNVAFMIGIGFYSENRFTIEQLFIRNPAEEYAVLLYLQHKLQQYSHLVTYNGRSFDWPVVKNRFVLHRLQAPAEPVHMDLLYPSRRLWKRTMPSCSLGTVEGRQLGFYRMNDVPGSMAPVLYVQYLTSENVEDIKGVFIHNEHDIVSLAALCGYLCDLIGGQPLWKQKSAEELFRLACWFDHIGRTPQTEEVLEALLQYPEREKSAFFLGIAQLYKRNGRHQKAVELWKAYIAMHNDRVIPAVLDPYIELAMYYEHRIKDWQEALHWAEAALSRARKRVSMARGGEAGRELLASLEKRCERLHRKQYKHSERKVSISRRSITSTRVEQVSISDLL